MVPTKHASVTQRLSGLSPKVLGWRAAATAMLVACVAHAERAPIAIAYDAAPGCPTIEEFVRKVAQRAENVEVVPSQSRCASGNWWTGGDSGSALMTPGAPCMASGCHTASSPTPMTMAGTVYAPAGLHDDNDCNGVDGAGMAIVVQDEAGMMEIIRAFR